MADIQITFTPEGEQDSEKVVLSLNIRKTLDGNIIVRDHSDIDIVIIPSKKKIVTFPKDTATEETYVTKIYKAGTFSPHLRQKYQKMTKQIS